MKRIKNHNQPVWIWTCLLAVLVIATAAVAGTCLYRFAHRSDCEISLYEGTISDGSIQSKTVSVKTGQEAQAEAQQYQFDVTDAEQVWTTETAVELFDVSYTNENGEITVQSANSDKVIAPGTEGSYTFDLKNTGSKTADYKIWVETRINSELSGMPLQTRMSGYSGWLLGDKDSWEQASALDGISTQETIEPGKSAEYKIYWQWPFEQENDEADTDVGNLTVGQKLTYTVIIHTLAAESTTGSTDGNDLNHTTGLLTAVKTGDTASVLRYGMIAAIAAAVIVLAVFGSRKRKTRQ